MTRTCRRLASACAVALTLVVACVGTAPTANAAWGVSGQGAPASAAAALVMPAGVTPTVTGSGTAAARMFTVSWTAPPSTTVPIEGYQITRTSSLLGAGLVSAGSCVGVTTALGLQRVVVVSGSQTGYSCTDSSLVTLGTVRYTVTPIYRRWVGVASDWSGPAT